MSQNKTVSANAQKGSALVMFLLIAPAMLGMMTLGIVSGGHLRTKTEVGDAVEVASLAVSASGGYDQKENEALARTYLETLLPDSKIQEVSIVRHECQDIPECASLQPGDRFNPRFAEYQLKVATRHGEVLISDRAVARKYEGISEPLDVVFVADFSGSMRDYWSNGRKIDMLKRVLAKVAKDIESYSLEDEPPNRMAVVPFHFFTLEKTGVSNQFCAIRQVEFDISSAVENLFVEKNCFDSQFVAQDREDFFTEGLMADADKLISIVNSMSSGWGTSSFEGIIRAAQILRIDPEPNPNRLIIVLSDGMDWHSDHSYMDVHGRTVSVRNPDWVHRQLLSRNYCDLIRQELSSDMIDGKAISSKIAVIGFDYNMNANENLKRCAGVENIYSARDEDNLYNLIIGLIAEEVGHLYRKGTP